MFINVTQEDINRGGRLIPELCPIALAVKRTFKKEAAVGISQLSVYTNPGDYVIYNLPAVAKKFIADFDGERPVEPIMFEVVEEQHGL